MTLSAEQQPCACRSYIRISMLSRLAGLLVAAAIFSGAHGKSLLEPASGSYFGVSIDFSTTSVSQYLTQAGVKPVIWNVFVSLPLNATTTAYLQQTLPQVAAIKGVVLLSVEPDQGLQAVTPQAVQELATYITTYEQAGASFMIRYAHEMNGNWYVWGQQPSAYIASHQLVTGILRNSTCGVAMVWSPNSQTGYPWAGNFQSGTALAPAPTVGSADFKLMDTNGDGKLTSADDPYASYYPGDAWVDWVGMSSFHFGGEAFPFTSNQQAAPRAFTNGFTGAGTTPPGVNFYESYCEDGTHNKPMVITETSAMYNPSNPDGQSDFSIKSNWWQQVFNVQGDSAQALDMSTNFPKVKAIMWFDEIKVEAQAGGARIDWRFTGNQQINSGLSIYVQTPAKSNGKKYWLQLTDFTSSNEAITCSANKPIATGAANKTAAAPITATTATFSTRVPISSPPPPVGVSAAQNAASAQAGAAATTQQAQSSSTGVGSFIGRRLFGLL